MDIHKNARLTPRRGEEMTLAFIQDRFCRAEAARICGVSAKIVLLWSIVGKSGSRFCANRGPTRRAKSCRRHDLRSEGCDHKNMERRSDST